MKSRKKPDREEKKKDTYRVKWEKAVKITEKCKKHEIPKGRKVTKNTRHG